MNSNKRQNSNHRRQNQIKGQKKKAPKFTERNQYIAN